MGLFGRSFIRDFQCSGVTVVGGEQVICGSCIESIYQGFVSLGYCNSFSIVEFLLGSSPKKKIFLLVDYPRVVFLLKSSSKTFHSSPNSCVLLLFWIEVLYLCFFFFFFFPFYGCIHLIVNSRLKQTLNPLNF